ncbi:MAG: response regulator [Nanoarchaeota archaeon]|nr:response regulator [Nanoarchaeota archaeon]
MSLEENIETIRPVLRTKFNDFVRVRENLKVLLVDDQINILRTSKEILEDFGCEVSVAATGSDLVNFVLNQDYDVALIDQKLGDKDLSYFLEKLDGFGFDMSKKPWSLVSAYEPEVDYTKWGVQHIFQKPFGVSDLLHFVMKSINPVKCEFDKGWFETELKRLGVYDSGISVLFVDDDPSVRRVVNGQLNVIFQGLNVSESMCQVVGSGEEAVDLLCSSSFNLVFWDFMLNGGVASDYLEKIRGLEREGFLSESSAVHVYVTDKKVNEPELVYARTKLGVQDKLTKPFSTKDLAAVIIKELDIRQKQDYKKQIVQSKEEFIGILARTKLHSVNNKLTSLVGYFTLLNNFFNRLDLTSSERDRYNHFYSKISQAAVASVDYVRQTQLLYHAGIESRTFRMKPLAEFAADALISQGMQVSTDFTEADPRVYGYEDGFLEAFLDLGQNALQAGASSLTIGLHDGEDKNGYFVHAYVEDDGSGIDSQNVERIFEHGFSTKGEGRGKGLALVKKTMDVHNAQLWCDSEPGSGATFHFKLYQ